MTSEADSGPRYAPDDPTLPKPWKGLLHGNNGVVYYWNPETNVTQYERPVSEPPPTVPAVSVPQSDSMAATQSVQLNGMLAQHGQYTQNVPQQQTQYMNQVPQLHGAPAAQQVAAVEQAAYKQAPQMAQVGHQGSQLGSSFQPQYMQYGQGMQPKGQQPGPLSAQQGQALYHQPAAQMGQQPSYQAGQNMAQHGFMQMQMQFSQQTPSHQGTPMGQPMQPHFSHQQPQQHHQQQPQYMQYSQPMPGPGHQGGAHQAQYMQQGPSYSYQPERNMGHPQRVDNEQGVFPKAPSQAEQAGNVGPRSTPALNTPNTSRAGDLSNQFPALGSGTNTQPSNANDMLPKTAPEVHPHHGLHYENKMGTPMMYGQQHGLPPGGLNVSYEGAQQGRGQREYPFNDNKSVPAMAPDQPRLATVPSTRFQQEMRSGPHWNAPPGVADGMHAVVDHGFPKKYGHADGELPLQSHAMMREPPSVPGSSDMGLLSPAEAYRKQHEVTATGENVPAPFMTFEATGFPPEILREMYAAGFASPTPIQAQTWPIALQNKDIVAIAKTGSGKTLGYLIPAFMHLRRRRNNPQMGPTVLVLAPTRELAVQIQDEAIKFGRSSRVSCTCLYGGAPKGHQLKELEHGADIVVATPGRLNDILEMKRIEFGQVSLLVLDEADRMLDMGFEPQIRKIVNEIPPHRQTLMYTATWPKEVRKIASDLLVNPVQVNIGNVDELAANKSITQYVEIVPQMEKQRRLEQILRAQERGSKVIVFCSTKKLCDELAHSFSRRNFPAAAIHGDKSQGERDWVLNQFRDGKSPILIATDVAARGLDIKDIRVVINFDFPNGVEDYVHRIGRTGRAGATGVAYTFFSEQDWKHAADLVKVLEGANQVVPPELRDIASRGAPPFSRDRGGMSRFEPASSGGYGDRGGIRDGGFSGRGGMRDEGGFGGRSGFREGGSGFVGRGGMREGGGFGGRGGMRDGGGFGDRGGFGGRGGMRDGGGSWGRGGMRDNEFDSYAMRDGYGARGGRSDFFGGRGNRGRGFGGPGGDRDRWGREDRGPYERFNSRDGYGRGRGRGRGRFDDRREDSGRRRGRSYSRSPEKVSTWRHSSSRSSSRSRSRSRSRSCSWTRSRSRDWSRSRSPRRSYSRGRDRSRSRSYDRYKKPERQEVDQKDLAAPLQEQPVNTQIPDQNDIKPSHEETILVPPAFPLLAGEPDNLSVDYKPSTEAMVNLSGSDATVNLGGSEAIVEHGDHQPVNEV